MVDLGMNNIIFPCFKKYSYLPAQNTPIWRLHNEKSPHYDQASTIFICVSDFPKLEGRRERYGGPPELEGRRRDTRQTPMLEFVNESITSN
jgi:hypothetical protein